METIEKKVLNLPKDLQQEVSDFIDFLLSKQASKIKKKPDLNWIGGLKEFRNQYSALELQKKAQDWRD